MQNLPELRRILLNFDQMFSGLFPKMQQLSRAFTELSRSLHAAFRTIPDRYQFLRTLHAPRCPPFLAHTAPLGLPAALRDMDGSAKHSAQTVWPQAGTFPHARRLTSKDIDDAILRLFYLLPNVWLTYFGKRRVARSRLYRSRLLQPNGRWKALAEIYRPHRRLLGEEPKNQK